MKRREIRCSIQNKCHGWTYTVVAYPANQQRCKSSVQFTQMSKADDQRSRKAFNRPSRVHRAHVWSRRGYEFRSTGVFTVRLASATYTLIKCIYLDKYSLTLPLLVHTYPDGSIDPSVMIGVVHQMNGFQSMNGGSGHE